MLNFTGAARAGAFPPMAVQGAGRPASRCETAQAGPRRERSKKHARDDENTPFRRRERSAG
jgi:hypothetical protein